MTRRFLLMIWCLASVHHADFCLAAENDDVARAKFEEGIAALKMEDFPKALLAFEASYQLKPKISVLYNIGMCEKALFRYTEAMATLEKLLADSKGELTSERQKEVTAALAEIETRIGKLMLAGAEPNTVLFVDGRSQDAPFLTDALLMNPGHHVIELRQDKQEVFRKEITIVAGETLRVAVPAPTTPPASIPPTDSDAPSNAAVKEAPTNPSASTRKAAKPPMGLWVGGIAALTVGAAGIAVGGIYSYKWNEDYDMTVAASKECERVWAEGCQKDYHYYSERLPKEKAALTAGFVTGVIGVAAGVVLIVLYSRRSHDAVAFRTVPGGVSMIF